jgi:hypothetical protein
MAGRINHFLREYIFLLSLIITGLGIIILIIGAVGTFSDMFVDTIGDWNVYIVAIGIILSLTGIYYLYSYLSKKRFVLSELETNKRSEFIKRHKEVKSAVKFLPKKYSKLLIEKEKELKIK